MYYITQTRITSSGRTSYRLINIKTNKSTGVGASSLEELFNRCAILPFDIKFFMSPDFTYGPFEKIPTYIDVQAEYPELCI